MLSINLQPLTREVSGVNQTIQNVNMSNDQRMEQHVDMMTAQIDSTTATPGNVDETAQGHETTIPTELNQAYETTVPMAMEGNVSYQTAVPIPTEENISYQMTERGQREC